MPDESKADEDLSKLQARLNSLQAQTLAEEAWKRLTSHMAIATIGAVVAFGGLGSYAFSEAKHSIEDQLKETVEKANEATTRARFLSEEASTEVQNATDKASAAAQTADKLTEGMEARAKQMEDRVEQLQAQLYTLEKLSTMLGQTVTGGLQATAQVEVPKEQKVKLDQALKTAIATTKALEQSKNRVRIIYKSNTGRHSDANAMKDKLAGLGYSAVVVGSNLTEVKSREPGTVSIFGAAGKDELLKELGNLLGVPPHLRLPDNALPDDAQIILY